MKAAESVLFNGYLTAHTGYGAAARSYAHAMLTANLELCLVERESRADESRGLDEELRKLLRKPIRPRHIICHDEPLAIGQLARRVPHLIGLTTWEGDHLPDNLVHTLEATGELWVPSRFNERVFASRLKVPVFSIPHPISSVALSPRIDNAAVLQRCKLTSSAFVFTSIATWQERKNLLAVIRAFTQAFKTSSDAVLVVKTSFRFVDEAEVRAEVAGIIGGVSRWSGDLSSRIRIIGEPWTESEIIGLLQRTNCYVSTHRSEGWGYPLFDAACMGVPVIACAYSGPLDYLSADYHNLARCSLVPVDQSKQKICFAFEPSMLWAEVDVREVAELMTYVHQSKDDAMRRAGQGAVLLRNEFSRERIGRSILRRLCSRNVGPERLNMTAGGVRSC